MARKPRPPHTPRQPAQLPASPRQRDARPLPICVIRDICSFVRRMHGPAGDEERDDGDPDRNQEHDGVDDWHQRVEAGAASSTK